MLLSLCTYFLWLSISDLWTVQAKDPDTDVSTRSPHRDLAPNNVDFAFILYRHLVASAPGKNVFISPVSISMALAMLSLGSCGHTRIQLLQGLGFNLTNISEAEIHQGFKHLHHLFEKESDTMLEMVMGTWEQPFNPESTREENFYVNETTVVRVPMMVQSGPVKYFQDPVLSCQLVQLEYTGNETVFFVLPEEGKMDTVITALSRDTIQRWSESLTMGSQVNLSIPKVTISGAYNLRTILGAMGIADFLSKEADFSGIAREPQLTLSEVIHKAVLQLDEKGLEGADSPRVMLRTAPEPLTFSFNRPFIVMIFNHFTWSSLFLGKVVNPT
ncbi:corticosteroid-binding globulin isoform X3 [Mustela erminea]|uniref:corticosteroid-binding globulin isoform X3 n=1 Tax=Mustela erminea TaxID=36723 RepID=UPI0013867369|nr:corticosteroid-binding globulin isoform X3 [Mustela erminea]